MRLRAFVYCSAVLLAAVAVQNSFFHSHQGDNATVSACSSDHSGCVTTGPGPATTESRHSVLAGACPGGDLHVMHYEPGPSGGPLVATWCK